MRRILINDITLRDGEQSPGVNFFPEEKLEIAKRLRAMGVPIIEAGFAAASESDWNGINLIARELGADDAAPVICSMCRANEKDIAAAHEALRPARRPRIQVVLSTSDLHMKYKLQITREQALEIADRTVRYARSLVEDVEFAAEDATRTDLDFLLKVFEVAVKAGARTIEIPDTVGFATPIDYTTIVSATVERVKLAGGAIVATHCHDDLGLAAANTLAGIAAGAGQAEVTVNGIGERAGNAALEEVVMALRTRPTIFDADTGIDVGGITAISKLVSKLSRMAVAPNKAIVGYNAFRHESGIHQHGMLVNSLTYQIIEPSDVGAEPFNLVIGKLSGKHALKSKIESLGLDVSNAGFDKVYREFKDLAAKKKLLMDEDIVNLVTKVLGETAGRKTSVETSLG
jgi:2-isopropylmalate synthase